MSVDEKCAALQAQVDKLETWITTVAIREIGGRDYIGELAMRLERIEEKLNIQPFEYAKL